MALPGVFWIPPVSCELSQHGIRSLWQIGWVSLGNLYITFDTQFLSAKGVPDFPRSAVLKIKQYAKSV